LAPHLAVGDDVEACPLLVADGDDRSVVLRLFEPLRGDAPEFPGTYAGWKALAEVFAIDQPVGLGVASHQRRWQQRQHSVPPFRLVSLPHLRAGEFLVRPRAYLMPATSR